MNGLAEGAGLCPALVGAGLSGLEYGIRTGLSGLEYGIRTGLSGLEYGMDRPCSPDTGADD